MQNSQWVLSQEFRPTPLAINYGTHLIIELILYITRLIWYFFITIIVKNLLSSDNTYDNNVKPLSGHLSKYFSVYKEIIFPLQSFEAAST